ACPADVVQLVAHTREAPRAALLLVLFVVSLVTDARAERDAGAVRRPRDAGSVLLELGQLDRLAAPEREHVDLRGLVLAALRGERELRSIRRPARRRIVGPRRE